MAGAGTTTVRFRYRALGADGQAREGQLQAAGEPEALRAVMALGLTPLAVQAVGAAPVSAARQGGIRPADRLVLVQELSTLLGAGIALGEALPSLVTAYGGQPLGAVLEHVDREVRGGQPLSRALAGSRLGLPGYALALVDAGEASGALAAALRDAAEQMDHDRKAAQELRSALIYPGVLVSAGLVAVLLIFVGVVPRFAGLLRNSRADMPQLSRWIIESGLYVQQHLLGFALGAGVLLAVLVAAGASAALRARALDAASRLPVIGDWLLRVDLGRWSSVLGSLLANRVPIVAAISLSQGALRLPRLREDLAGTAREIERGKALSEVLLHHGWFPPTRLNLVRVGERAGELPRMLATLGAMETEAARLLQRRVLALIEPASILLIGAVIGVIMVAVMMAITSLNTVVL